MSPTAATRDPASLLQAHSPVGASTGFMWDLRGDWPAQIETACTVSSSAVELSALSENELEPLLRFLSGKPKLPFRFTAVHGPSKNRTLDEEDLVNLLVEVARYCDGIVMHPDTMGELAPYSALGNRLLIENMDSRKSEGRTVGELKPAFESLPDARFCFDIAHARSIDPSMGEANRLLDAFGTRLSHVHLSSLSPDLRHVSLTSSDAELFESTLQRCVDVPWILEAPPPDLN